MSQQATNSNSSAPKHKVDYDSDILLAQLPAEIRHFVLYEVSVKVYLPTVQETIWKHGTLRALKIMRENLAKDAIKLYGEKYPQRWLKPIGVEDLGL